ncbi:MAG TPA: hypothetical protein VGG03_10395 [Thermoanaerobaculia bacterium]
MSQLKFRLIALAFVLISVLAAGRTNAARPGGGGTTECPQKSFSGVCIQVITYARNPETGTCCVYPNPCVVPDGWATSYEGCP